MISVLASVKFCLFEKLVYSLFHSKKNIHVTEVCTVSPAVALHLVSAHFTHNRYTNTYMNFTPPA